MPREDAVRVWQPRTDRRSYPVAAAKTIAKYSLVALGANGYATPAQDTAGFKFVGLAAEYIDNSSGAAGAEYVTVLDNVDVEAFDCTRGAGSITQSFVGTDVYVGDSDLVTIAKSYASKVKCGRLLHLDTLATPAQDVTFRVKSYVDRS